MELNNYFLSRATIRSFSKKEISKELLDSIVIQAAKAPTTGGMQLYSIVVNRDIDNIKKIAQFHFNQSASTGCNVMLTVCADFNKFSKWCEISNAVPGYDNFLSFVTALQDATILAQQIVTIAEMNGLGTCYLGTVLYNAKEISDFLKLPSLAIPVASIALGYPVGEGTETERLPLDGILFDEEYPSLSNNQIKEIFSVKEEFAPNKKFVQENGKSSLAQVFTDIRYPKQMNETVSEKLIELLKQKRFL